MAYSETLEAKDVTSEYQVKSLLDNMLFLNSVACKAGDLTCVYFTAHSMFIVNLSKMVILMLLHKFTKRF